MNASCAENFRPREGMEFDASRSHGAAALVRRRRMDTRQPSWNDASGDFEAKSRK